MKFSRVSTFLFGLIASITGVGTLYISLLQPSPSLTAYVHDGIFYVPAQYTRQEKEIEQLTNSFHIRSSLNEYEEYLSYSQKKNIADMLSDSIEKAKKPFFPEVCINIVRWCIFMSITTVMLLQRMYTLNYLKKPC